MDILRERTGDPKFRDLLAEALGEMDRLRKQATDAVDRIPGDGSSGTAVREADRSLQRMAEIRDRLVAAYEDLLSLKV